MKRKKFYSEIFGETEKATAEEVKQLQQWAKEIPVALFQAVSAVMNSRGAIIHIKRAA